MSSKFSLVFLITVFSIVTDSPLAHAQVGRPLFGGLLNPIVGPIAGPILGQPVPPIVCQAPLTVPPVVPNILSQIPVIVGQILPVNITIAGILSCSLPGTAPGPGISGVNVSIICGNSTIAQAVTNSQGIFSVSLNTNTSILSGNTCIARVGLPIAGCTLFPISGALQAPIMIIGNIVQDVAGLVITAFSGIFSLVTVTTPSNA
uniref:Phylloplanin n=1 Tax=Solanum lycopersicum TaxID=4081 RepID=A0A3Q7I6P1_SOLLC